MPPAQHVRRRCIVVFTGAIGDTLLAGSALLRLARERALTIAGYPERLDLLKLAGVPFDTDPLDATGFSSMFSTPSAQALAFFGAADEVLIFMADKDGSLRSGITACGLGHARIVPPLPPQDGPLHASDYYWQMCGIEGETPVLHLQPEPRAFDYDVAIHPGSGSATKNWPLERYEELAQSMTARGLRVAHVTGPAEEGLRMAHAMPLPPMSLTQVASALAGARAYVGNDSGITHLAAAVGCPTIAIFGPTNPAIWAPRGSHVRVVQGSPWPIVGEVLAATLRMLGIEEPV